MSVVSPYDYGEAKAAHARASRAQEAAARYRETCAADLAAAEESYRVALAQSIVRLHDEDGVAWSVCADLARGDRAVAQLRARRDIAKGMLEAAEGLSWKANADRRGVEQLVAWAMREGIS